ncbi:SET domain-containing protein SmydA-8, isoform B [Amphibalanus amphitrite]|uniref:SET domain-containing protein SmydA-8, isoform B n=1 Tax=Amphibalanus amphitrite TaxID=1232801 RepID=A0A6A4VFY4_AMPAM|nr:SET domain-containing protein SmydA-8, isoform B [Amphibalanus amphitrite]
MFARVRTKTRTPAGGAKARPVVEDFTKPAAYLEAVTVVRLLKLRDADPARFERVLEMDSSPEHWPKSELSGVFQHNVVNFLRTVCKVNADEQLLQRLGGILMTNAFEARGRRLGSHVRCLFPEAGLLAHSCLPNVHHTIDHNFTIFLRAAEPVKEGLTYYELHAPLMVLAQRQYARGAISRTEMETLLDEASDNLEKAIGMLKYEPELSLEGKIHASALRSREELATLRGTVADLPETGRGHLTPAHIDELVGEFNAVLELMDDYQWRV